MSDLERSYRRLLRAYPGFYRRERGLEILTTLLDAAEPGQTRPSTGEAWYLLVIGLRYRLVPPTWIGKIATGLVAIWAAVVLSGVGALAVWGVANPQQPDLAAFSDGLAGGPASSTDEVPGDNLLDMAYGYRAYGELQDFTAEGWHDRRPTPMSRSRVYEVAEQSTILARLRDAGWQTEVGEGATWAYRDGALLRVVAHGDQTGVRISAYPVEPTGVLAGAIVGFAVGLIIVWQLMTRLAHRVVRAPQWTRRTILLLGLPALIACAVNTVDNVLSMVPDQGTAGVLFAADYLYPLANQIADPLAFGVIALALISTGCLIAFARKRPLLRPIS